MPALALLRLHIGDLAVRTLFPDVEHIAVLLLAGHGIAGDITLFVIRQIAQYGVEGFSGVHHVRHLLWLDRLCLLGGLLDDLYGGVAVERVSLRLESLFSENLDNL